ncbi:DUF3093 domain-containing protein [Corynebacterium endometrii]|uniref:DUF3093 domain-containing protein n=1 Tax=Corynebacterium endometrii TaxID=2488819 RepID=UPI00319E166D
MTNKDEESFPLPDSTQTPAQGSSTVLYSERHWVPWHFWPLALIVVIITTGSLGLNRSIAWGVGAFIITSIIAIWILLAWSKTTVSVEQDPDGTRWLIAGDAQLPHDVVARSLAVPASARRAALGPQLDPAAFLVTRPWVKQLAMFVLDDPEDSTPYWLVAAKNPEALLEAFVPQQLDEALTPLRKK